MHKIRKLLILAVVVMSVMICGAANAEESGKGVVVADDINMRAEPNKESALLTTIPLYTEVEVLSYADDWYKVLHDGMIGYIRSDLLFVNNSDARVAYAKADGVLLRGGASANSYVVETLGAGESLRIKSIIGDWYYASCRDTSGYVHLSEITVSRPGSSSFRMLLKSGMSGEDVLKLQKELYDRGFLSKVDVTGHYGSNTRKAVSLFQEACGLDSDGIAGDGTLEILYDESNTITHATAVYNQVKGTVELLDWFNGGSDWLRKGAYFKVTDVETGMSFNVRRFGGWYHADSEPVTADDTAIFKAIVGEWTWNRRAIWVTYRGRTVAASMNCMPHMANPTQSNNFDGHFCIHLYHSKVHANSRECPRHQSCVMKAYNAGKA